MTKILNFALKIKGGGREGGTCEVLRPCHPPKFGTCTSIMISSHGTQISKDGIPPTVLNTPTVLKISPTFIMISPHGTEHPPRYSRNIIAQTARIII